MKKYLVYLSIIMVTLVSCKGNQKKEQENPYDIKPEMSISKQDTTTILDACKAYFDKLVQKDYTGAVSMLKNYNQETQTLEDLSDSVRQVELNRIQMFPVYGYEIQEIQFYKENDSEVKYFIYINQPEDGSEPAKMSVTFRPVRQGNQWFLTLANSFSEINNSILDK